MVAKRASREDLNASITQAWYGELFARQKRLKQVHTYWLKDTTRSTQQSPEELKLLLYQLADRYGGKVREVPQEAAT